MYPEEFARPVKQQVLAQAKGYAYVCAIAFAWCLQRIPMQPRQKSSL